MRSFSLVKSDFPIATCPAFDVISSKAREIAAVDIVTIGHEERWAELRNLRSKTSSPNHRRALLK